MSFPINLLMNTLCCSLEAYAKFVVGRGRMFRLFFIDLFLSDNAIGIDGNLSFIVMIGEKDGSG